MHRGQVPFRQFSQRYKTWATTLDLDVPATTNCLLAGCLLLVFMMDGATCILPPCSWLGRFVVEDCSTCMPFNCACRPAPLIGWDALALGQIVCCSSWTDPDRFWGFDDGCNWDCMLGIYSVISFTLSTLTAWSWPGDKRVWLVELGTREGLKRLRAAPFLLRQKRPENRVYISFNSGTFSARWLARDSGCTREKNRRSLSVGSFCAMSSNSVVRSWHLVEAR